MSRLSIVCASIALSLLISGCSLAEGRIVDGRMIHLGSQPQSRPLVCAEPQPSDAPDWSDYDPLTFAPAPYELLYEGGFLVCHAYQLGMITNEDYRRAERDRPKLVLRTLAAVSLTRLGETDPASREEMRGWHVNSAFLEVACRSRRSDDPGGNRAASDPLISYCTALDRARGGA